LLPMLCDVKWKVAARRTCCDSMKPWGRFRGSATRQLEIMEGRSGRVS
jgi:hypothetical protein